MKTASRVLLSLVTLTACLALARVPAANATIVWVENFSVVTDWTVILNPGGATITTDGNLGSFNVPPGNAEAAFGPITGVAPLVSFSNAEKHKYTLSFDVDSLTGSTSYDIRLDQFDANTNYISTVFNVFPQGTFTGTTNVSLAGFTFSGSAAFILPKISVFTGDPNQTVVFDNMEFDLIPEPSTTFLLALGGVIVARRRSKCE